MELDEAVIDTLDERRIRIVFWFIDAPAGPAIAAIGEFAEGRTEVANDVKVLIAFFQYNGVLVFDVPIVYQSHHDFQAVVFPRFQKRIIRPTLSVQSFDIVRTSLEPNVSV